MTAGSAAPLDVRGFIDGRKVSAYQWLILALCTTVAFMDGFDTSAMAFVAPVLLHNWGIPRSALGPMMAAALVGFAAGGFIAGPIGDRIGRKGILVASVILFSLSTLAAALANSVEVLAALRVVAGLGCGAAIPNAAALLAEYSPERRTSLSVSFMFCGFTLGGACSGFVGAALIPLLGWQSMFLLGGSIPLVLAALAIPFLPESARFMVAINRPKAQIAATLARVAPDAREMLEAAPGFVVPAKAVAEVRHPIRTILRPPLVVGSLLLWAVFFSGLVVIYLMTSWLPTLLNDGGFSVRASANLTALFQLGGTVGAMLVAWLMGKIGPHRAIAISYGIGAVSIVAMSQSIHHIGVLAACVVGTGFFISGAQTSMTALAAAFYPTPARATGMGWMLGVGRMGAITGAFAGGPLLALGYGFTSIVAAMAAPLALAAGFVAFKGIFYARERSDAPA